HALHVAHVILPARGANHKIDVQRRNAQNILDGRGWHGKVDRYVYTSEVFGGDALELRVVEFIELERDLDAARFGGFLDHAAHFSVADYCYFHDSKTSGSSSRKNSSWSAFTA